MKIYIYIHIYIYAHKHPLVLIIIGQCMWEILLYWKSRLTGILSFHPLQLTTFFSRTSVLQADILTNKQVHEERRPWFVNDRLFTWLSATQTALNTWHVVCQDNLCSLSSNLNRAFRSQTGSNLSWGYYTMCHFFVETA